LEEKFRIPTLEEVDMAERKWVTADSKKFDAADYDPISQTLYIRFHFQKSKNGKPVYAYGNVSPKQFHDLMTAKEVEGGSQGRYLNQHIIGNVAEHPFSPQGVEKEPG
jgi:hypothetical protein